MAEDKTLIPHVKMGVEAETSPVATVFRRFRWSGGAEELSSADPTMTVSLQSPPQGVCGSIGMVASCRL